MAETTAKKPAESKPVMAKIKLQRAAAGEENFITASYNGKIYKIQKGVEIEVPAPLAQVIENAYEQQDRADEFISSLVK